jgi:hypothetical protein
MDVYLCHQRFFVEEERMEGKEVLTSTSALRTFSILSKMRMVGLCQKALSNQYLKRDLRVGMGCSEYLDRST